MAESYCALAPASAAQNPENDEQCADAGCERHDALDNSVAAGFAEVQRLNIVVLLDDPALRLLFLFARIFGAGTVGADGLFRLFGLRGLCGLFRLFGLFWFFPGVLAHDLLLQTLSELVDKLGGHFLLDAAPELGGPPC